MKFKIHYTLPGGIEDYIVCEGETIEEIRGQADEIKEARQADNFWSEEL